MIFELAGRKCTFDRQGTSGPCVITGVFPGHRSDIFSLVSGMICDMDYSLFTYELSDWESECAPWNAVINDRTVIGRSADMLEWIRRNVIREFAADCERLTAGYSMSGLLSIWMLYNTDLFAGSACCSGSLWYPGWMEFAGSHGVGGKNVSVYLSLGGKEARTAPAYMASIENNMRLQYDLIRSDPNVSAAIFEMNPGGHFTKTDERLAKGIAWLLKQRKKASMK